MQIAIVRPSDSSDSSDSSDRSDSSDGSDSSDPINSKLKFGRILFVKHHLSEI